MIIKIAYYLSLLALLCSVSSASGGSFISTEDDSLLSGASANDTSSVEHQMGYEVFRDLPLRSFPDLFLTIPMAHSVGSDLYVNNMVLNESNIVIDGMQVRYGKAFPYRGIRQIHNYTMTSPINLGNSLNLVGISTVEDIDSAFISVEAASDFRFYTMKTDYPIESKSGNTHFYPYGNDLIALNGVAPINLGKRKGGVSLALELSKRNEQYPSSINNYQVTADALTSLQNDPLRATGTGSGSYENAEYISTNDIEQTRYSSNSGIKGINSYLRVGLPISDKVELSLGSYINVSKSRQFIYENSMFNSSNNPEVITRNFDNYAQLSHTILERESTKLSYTAQFTYSNYYNKIQSADHKDELLRYGYLGKFTTYTEPSYEFGTDSLTGFSGLIQNGFVDTLYTFEPGGFNPVAEMITTDYYDLYSGDPVGHYENRNQVLDGGGLLNGYMPGSLTANVYNVWNSPGRVDDLFSIKSEEVLREKFLMELAHKSHRIQLGFELTNQTERSYVSNPIALWQQMRLLTNSHILQLDKSNPMPVYTDTIFAGTVNYPRLYDGASQATFDKNLRQKLGLAINGTDWIDVNALPYETLSLDMFSADEVSGFMSYYGYDYLGNKIDDVNALNYFSEQDDVGNFLRNVGAYKPKSGAGYVNYAYVNKRLKASVGLRADYFNSNQPVLKDKYSLFEIQTVSAVAGSLNPSGSHPTSMGGEFAVYVNDLNHPTAIMGYRDGDQWYNASGDKISSAQTLLTSGGVLPLLVNPNAGLADAFENSESIVNVLPQVSIKYSFNFGWSVFFSHATATQNPRYYNVFRPDQYMTIQSSFAAINNTALPPLRTTKDKIGVSQNIDGRTTLELYAYIVEYDQVQVTAVNDAYPITYLTYGVFGSSLNGVTLSLERRASRNAGLSAGTNLSVQFGDATTSSNIGKIANGYLAYNFSTRSQYKGFTTEKGKQPLRNVGIGLFFHLRDGTKYSKHRYVTQEGGINYNGTNVLDGTINGSQVTPTAFLNLKIEKGVDLEFSKIRSRIDFYIMIQNIMNRKNIVAVYGATGDPSDDGYLADPGAQPAINSHNDPDLFRALYALKVDDPRHYAAPRVIRVGAVFNF